MAKYVPNDTFNFDDSVKKNEASYLLSYAPPEQAEADQSALEPTGKKIPLAVTLIGMFIVCGALWCGIAFIIIKLVSH